MSLIKRKRCENSEDMTLSDIHSCKWSRSQIGQDLPLQHIWIVKGFSRLPQKVGHFIGKLII